MMLFQDDPSPSIGPARSALLLHRLAAEWKSVYVHVALYRRRCVRAIRRRPWARGLRRR